MSTHNTFSPATAESGGEPTRNEAVYRPLVDIVERPDEVLIVADMPGVEPADIDVQFENKSLAIRGRARSRQHDGTRYLVQEYGVGDFYRVFQLNEDIDPRRIQAEYRQGVLRLHLPKAEAAKPRKIDVQVAG